jgi:glucokinase
MSQLPENILLCDMGGTHARFAKLAQHGKYTDFKKYKLHDFPSFEDIVHAYIDETNFVFQNARFAVARTPQNGVISYKRFAGDPDYTIDFNTIKKQFGWNELTILNDLEAGAHGACVLDKTQSQILIPSKTDKINDHKILISVGTGVGHAGIMNGQILRTAGGHFFPVTVTSQHRKFESFIRARKGDELALIMEDFVSARGLRMITEYVSGKKNDSMSNAEFMIHLKEYPDATHLFFEFLGLHAQNLVSVMGFYGGVYVNGGVIDYLIKYDLADWDAFAKFLRPSDMTSVLYRLQSAPVHYVIHDELPLLGLASL